jgi:hypothetical protein
LNKTDIMFTQGEVINHYLSIKVNLSPWLTLRQEAFNLLSAYDLISRHAITVMKYV